MLGRDTATSAGVTAVGALEASDLAVALAQSLDGDELAYHARDATQNGKLSLSLRHVLAIAAQTPSPPSRAASGADVMPPTAVPRAPPAPPRELCVFYANCQGAALAHFLGHYHDAFAARYEIAVIRVDKLIAAAEPLDPARATLLARAALFIHQPIGPRHGTLSTEPTGADDGAAGGDRAALPNARSRLRAGCAVVSFPYLYCDGLWPLAPHKSRVDGGAAVRAELARGASEARLTRALLAGTLDVGLRARFEASLAELRAREAATSVRGIADYVEARVASERVFHTQNHPATGVLLRVAQGVLGALELAPLDERALAARGVGENDARLPGQWPPSVYEAKEYAMAWHPPNVGVPRFYVEQLRRVVREWRAEQRASAQGLTSCESGTPPNGILDIEGDEDDDDPPYSEGAPAALDMTKLSA